MNVYTRTTFAVLFCGFSGVTTLHVSFERGVSLLLFHPPVISNQRRVIQQRKLPLQDTDVLHVNSVYSRLPMLIQMYRIFTKKIVSNAPKFLALTLQSI